MNLRLMSSVGRKTLLTVLKAFGYTFCSVIVVADTVGYVAKVDGLSMQPTFNSDGGKHSDYVLLSRWKSRNYEFKRGQIVSFISPREPNLLLIKRIVALEGDTVVTRPRCKHRSVQVPTGHCWVEGDNVTKSLDSNTFGIIPLGLISAVSLYIIWPPKRWKRIDIELPEDRMAIEYPNHKYLISFDPKKYRHIDNTFDNNIGVTVDEFLSVID